MRYLSSSIVEILPLLIVVILLAGCQKEFIDSENSNSSLNDLANLRSEGLLLSVSYDLEINSKVVLDGSTASVDPLDKISSRATKLEQEVNLEVYGDGEYELTIDNIIDSNEFNVPQETLPNNFPNITKTVQNTSSIEYYDSQNQLLGTENISTPKLLDLVDIIDTIKDQYATNAINQAIANMQSDLYDINLQDLLDWASIYGYPVYDMPGDNIAIKMPVNASGTTYAGDSTYTTDESILLIDESRNLLMAASLYDEQENTKVVVFYGYKSTGTPFLESIHKEILKPMPSNEVMRMIIDYKIENLTISVT